MLTTGIKGEGSLFVTDKDTAAAIGSGLLDVFGTPSMIALMEDTAQRSVAAGLSEGESTVGTHLDVSHLAATPVGMRVRCESELVEVDGRRLVFRLEVFDEAGKVGEGTHERFIIRNERFLAKAEARKTR